MLSKRPRSQGDGDVSTRATTGQKQGGNLAFLSMKPPIQKKKNGGGMNSGDANKYRPWFLYKYNP